MSSAPRMSSPNAAVSLISAARKSTSRRYRRTRPSERDRQCCPAPQHPGVPAACPPPASCASGYRSKNVRSPTSPSARARAAPRQKCRPPENDRCLPALSRVMSKRCGSANTAGSRLARGQVDDHRLAGLHQRTRPRRRRPVAIRADELYRRFQPQDLLHGARPKIGLIDQQSQLVGMFQQDSDAVAQQVDRGFEPGGQHQSGGGPQLVSSVVPERRPRLLAMSWLIRSSPGLRAQLPAGGRPARR